MTKDLNLIELTADIVSAHVSSNSVPVSDLPRLIEQIYRALTSLGKQVEEPEREKSPAVTARASVKPNYLICMECGRKQKLLRRHLLRAHGLTPDRYRAAFGLPGTYPMVAPEYSKRRSEMAHLHGLGTKRSSGTGAGAAKASTPKRGDKPKASAGE
jgi:predicted transcriptional regulator